MAAFRSVVFSLSKALSEGQRWAIESFPAIVQRATGYSEHWGLHEEAFDEATGASIWRYNVYGETDMNLVVDHITHELSDGVLLTETHSVREDCYFFGSARRDRPELLSNRTSVEETRAPNQANKITS
jgi:hypothetical protein